MLTSAHIKTVMRRRIPFIHEEQSGDEVFGFFRRIHKLLFLKVPLTGQDVIQGLVVIVTKEGTETAQTVGKRRTAVSISSFVHACARACAFTYSM